MERLDPTELFWRREKATRAGLIVDARAYFEVGRKAMLKARKRIMLIGWDFDARIELSEERLPGEPRTLNEFVLWLVKRNPELQDVEKWLADNQVLDPEGPEEIFEATTKGGLLRGLRGRLGLRALSLFTR